ncbi:hypothetical protein [Photorhabdus heterorhabditis]|uniref:hypothetical protein n=1 Tax=Photorhabdus heterorhabditis TaxID=880156 RepID=UPI001BD2039F|nr:hypothetical protein [Photorhabdus heterorhabditis]MBS9442503.1 hypothetical protein [Photorhabdus heterorhabditis]
MKRFGYWLLVIGLIWLLVAFNMETSVPSDYGSGRVSNIGMIASQHNHIFFGAFVTFCGLMMLLFGRSSGDVRCSYCAEFINKDASKCKHCGSHVRTADSSKALARTLVINSEYLKKADNYRYYDFFDKDSIILKQRVVEFCALCSSYIDEVQYKDGDEEIAEMKVASMIDTISSHMNEKQSKEFKKICEFHLPLI